MRSLGFLGGIAAACGLVLFADASVALPRGPVDSQPAMGTMLAAAKKRGGHSATPAHTAPAKKEPAPAPAPEPSQGAAEPAGAPPGTGAAGPSLSGTTRIDFDAMHIKGQTTKAGEVQILERKDTELKSMVKRRTSFREEIIRTVFPDK